MSGMRERRAPHRLPRTVLRPRVASHPAAACQGRKAASAGMAGSVSFSKGALARSAGLAWLSAAALHAGPVFAQDPPSPLGAGSLLQVFSGLVLVLLLVAAAAWMLRRVGAVPGVSNSAIKLLGAASVGARERVVLLEVGGSWIVVGVAPGQVRSLATLPKAELPAAPLAPAATPAFAQWLQRFTDRTHAS